MEPEGAVDQGGEEEHVLLLPLVTEENACLPLPINVVSRYWNVKLPLEVDVATRYAQFNGSVLIEGIESAQRYSLICKLLHSDLNGLKNAIDAGIPPIVILPGIPEITQHASVITGYDENENTILHYIQTGTQEGEQQEGAIPQDIFDKEWEEEGRLLILIAPPDTITSIGMQHENSDHTSTRMCFEAERSNILGDRKGATDTLKQAIRLNSSNVTALHMLGSMLNEQNMAECVKFYEQCLQINPRLYLAYSGLGNYHLKIGMLEKAEEYYTKAIKINPKRSAKIYKNRAYLLEKLGKNTDAKYDLKSYLKYHPRAPDRGIIEQAIKEL